MVFAEWYRLAVLNLLPLLLAMHLPSAQAQDAPEEDPPSADDPGARERTEDPDELGDDEGLDELPDAPLLAAAPATTLLVSEFEAMDEASASFASLLRSYLSEALAEDPSVEVFYVEDAPDFGEHSALVYLQSCPPGDYVGCALVVGQRMKSQYALTGTATETARGNRVDISVIDIANSRESLAFSLDVETGDDEIFITGVVDLVVAVIEGETGISEDVRDEDNSAALREAQREMNSELAGQLNDLKGELGDVSEVESLRGGDVDKPRYTMDDLSEELESEGAKPWERLRMTPSEYMRYKNAGMTINQWRQASLGKKGKFYIRGGGGFTRGMVDSRYYARYALESAGLTTVETYSWQSAVAGNGGSAGAWLGYGITPMLEVDVGVGLNSGSFTVEIYQDIVAREDPSDITSPYVVTDEDPREGEEYNGGTTWFGARLIAGFFPVSNVRPILGGGVVYTLMSSLPVVPPTDVTSFDRSTLLHAQVLGGVEASAGSLFDFYAALPVGILVGGRVSDTAATGQDILDNTEPVPTASLISTGVEVGIAIKLGGARIDTDGPMDLDLEDY